jgi:hypothetical protein
VNSHHIVIAGGASSGLFGVDPNPGGTPTTKWSYGRPHSGCTAYNEGFETGGLLVGDDLYVSGDTYLSKMDTSSSTNAPLLLWRYPIFGHRQQPVLSKAGDAVYLGHRTQGELHAIPTSDSCPMTTWKFETQQNISFSSAAVHPETGMVFIGVEDQCVYALDPVNFFVPYSYPTQQQYGHLRRWDFKSIGSSAATGISAFHSTPAVFKGTFGGQPVDRVLIGDNGGVVYALDVNSPCDGPGSTGDDPICTAGNNVTRAKWCFDTHHLSTGCGTPGNPATINACCDPYRFPVGCKPKAPSGCSAGSCSCTPAPGCSTCCSSCDPTICDPCCGEDPSSCPQNAMGPLCP